MSPLRLSISLTRWNNWKLRPMMIAKLMFVYIYNLQSLSSNRTARTQYFIRKALEFRNIHLASLKITFKNCRGEIPLIKATALRHPAEAGLFSFFCSQPRATLALLAYPWLTFRRPDGLMNSAPTAQGFTYLAELCAAELRSPRQRATES